MIRVFEVNCVNLKFDIFVFDKIIYDIYTLIIYIIYDFSKMFIYLFVVFRRFKSINL